jgi:hypothetical protein
MTVLAALEYRVASQVGLHVVLHHGVVGSIPAKNVPKL